MLNDPFICGFIVEASGYHYGVYDVLCRVSKQYAFSATRKGQIEKVKDAVMKHLAPKFLFERYVSSDAVFCCSHRCLGRAHLTFRCLAKSCLWRCSIQCLKVGLSDMSSSSVGKKIGIP